MRTPILVIGPGHVTQAIIEHLASRMTDVVMRRSATVSVTPLDGYACSCGTRHHVSAGASCVISIFHQTCQRFSAKP
jgi:hypothetical protein